MNSNQEKCINIIPKHQRITIDLEQKIKLGVYKTKIPGERTLATLYDANVLTINKAVTTLVKNNILKRVKGRGTFVNNSVEPKELFPILCLHEIKDNIIHNFFHAELFNSLNNTAHENKIEFKIFNAGLNDPMPTKTLLDNNNGLLRNCLNKSEFLGGFLFFTKLELLKDELKMLEKPFVPIYLGKLLPFPSLPNIVAIDHLADEIKAAKYLYQRGIKKMGIISPFMSGKFSELTQLSKELKIQIRYFKSEVEECLEWSDGILVEDDYFALDNIFKLAEFPPDRLVCNKNMGFDLPLKCAYLETNLRDISTIAWNTLMNAIKHNINKPEVTYVPAKFILPS